MPLQTAGQSSIRWQAAYFIASHAMASWLQSQLKAAEGLLEAVDRTAKKSIQSQGQQRSQPGPLSREPEHVAQKGEHRCLPQLLGTLHVSARKGGAKRPVLQGRRGMPRWTLCQALARAACAPMRLPFAYQSCYLRHALVSTTLHSVCLHQVQTELPDPS